MSRKIVLCSILLLCILLVCCRAGTDKREISVLSLEDIQKIYKEDVNGTFVKAVPYKKHMLVEYKKDSATYYDWFNTETGDRDLLPVWDTNARLKIIQDENSLLFISDGFHIPSGYSGPPFLILCERKKEQIDSVDDFFARKIDKYFRIEESVAFGGKSEARVSDIRVTLTGIELLFEAADPDNPMNMAWTLPLPYMMTTYIEEKSEFLIKFHNTEIDVKALNQKLKTAYENQFIASVEVLEEKPSCVISIHLKKLAKYYHLSELRLSEYGLPVAILSFRKEIGDMNY
ncbi:hypothetical protein [Lutispora sp.]|uniref:hypothetical protein n=1 Tax=Lutispora sp. TaxID=2828727 RepID=UPI003563FC89